MKQKILEAIDTSVQAVRQLTQPDGLNFIEKGARLIADCFQKGNKVLVAGNGGSLCDGVHFVEELTGFFRKKRPPLAAIALSEPAHLTCVGNDLGFNHIFARGVEAYGKKGDLFVGLSTSGNSPNIILAFERAQALGLKTVAFLGREGGKLKGCADLELIIEDVVTSDRVQEAHMTAMHIMIEMIEQILFYGPQQEKEEIVEEILSIC